MIVAFFGKLKQRICNFRRDLFLALLISAARVFKFLWHMITVLVFLKAPQMLVGIDLEKKSRTPVTNSVYSVFHSSAMKHPN